MESKYPKQILKLVPGMSKYQIVASVCRLLTRANVNMMTVANFSSIASSQQNVVDAILYCEQWVTITGKESYGIRNQGSEETKSTKSEEPDLPSAA